MLAFLLGITMEQHWELSYPAGTAEPHCPSWSRGVGRARLGSLALLLSPAAWSPHVCSLTLQGKMSILTSRDASSRLSL